MEIQSTAVRLAGYIYSTCFSETSSNDFFWENSQSLPYDDLDDCEHCPYESLINQNSEVEHQLVDIISYPCNTFIAAHQNGLLAYQQATGISTPLSSNPPSPTESISPLIHLPLQEFGSYSYLSYAQAPSSCYHMPSSTSSSPVQQVIFYQSPPSLINSLSPEELTGLQTKALKGTNSILHISFCIILFLYFSSNTLETVKLKQPIHRSQQLQQSRQPRTDRLCFTAEQLLQLETSFEYKKYLNQSEREKLSKLVGVTGSQVKTWYQNRRSKWKRNCKA